MAFDTTQSINQEQAWIEKYRAALDKNSAPLRQNPVLTFLKTVQESWIAWRAKFLEKSVDPLPVNAAISVAPEPAKESAATPIAGTRKKRVRRETSAQKSSRRRTTRGSKAS